MSFSVSRKWQNGHPLLWIKNGWVSLLESHPTKAISIRLPRPDWWGCIEHILKKTFDLFSPFNNTEFHKHDLNTVHNFGCTIELSPLISGHWSLIWVILMHQPHEPLLVSIYRWWASWVTRVAFPPNPNTTSLCRRSTACWKPLHLTPRQPPAANVWWRPPLRRWTAFRPPSPTVPQRTAPPTTAWTPLWLPWATSTLSMARVSPAGVLA